MGAWNYRASSVFSQDQEEAAAPRPHHGVLCESSPCSALWCLSPPAERSSAWRSPALQAAAATWQLRWDSSNTLSAVRLSAAATDDEVSPIYLHCWVNQH